MKTTRQKFTMTSERFPSSTSENYAPVTIPTMKYGFLHDSTLWGLRSPDITKELNEMRVNTYILKCEETYLGREDELQDDDLWEQIGLDFEDWKTEHFAYASKKLNHRLRNYLRDHGVFIPKNKMAIAHELAKVVSQDEPIPWPQEELNKMS